MFRFFIFWLLIISLVLSCSRNSQPEYLQAKTIPPVSLPDGADNQRLGQLYRLPQQPEEGVLTAYEVPYPPLVGVEGDGNIASLQKMNGEFWILSSQSSATTWSQVIAFLQSRNINIVKQDLATATIQTDWFDEVVQPGFAVRYQLRLERGLQPNTTEVYLENDKRLLENVSALSQRWQVDSQDRAHANWLAEILIKQLNNPEVSFGDSYLATTISLPEKITLTEIEEEPVLMTQVEAGRLDKAFIKALGENGFGTYARSTQQSVFHFDEYEVKEKKSTLFGLVSWGGAGFTKKSDHSLDAILANLPVEPNVNTLFPNVDERRGRKELPNVPGYLLVIRQHQDKDVVFVRDGYGMPLTANKAKNILNTLRLRLI